MKKLVTALLLISACVFAEGPTAVAIRNAKIVPVSGPVIAKGTIVLRNGLIEAVGENVQAPADAWVVDGEGMTVYPGLIDALSTVGIPGAAPATAAAGRGGRNAAAVATPVVAAAPAARSMGPEDRPQTTSWLLAADEIQAGDRRIETVRSGGITTAITFPTRGIFGGQGAAIDLVSGEKSGEMILASPMGQYLSVGGGGRGGGGGGGYPGSLMGVIAYIRQLYLDADYYKMVKEAYEKNPRGMQRPEYDRALEGLLASKRVLIPANRLVEMDRMIRISTELKQPTLLYGMHEAYRPEAIELLKKSGMTVLVSLRFPEPATGGSALDDDTLRNLQTYDMAPSAPALLKKAGVRFAFYSDGIDAARDLQRAVKKAIDAGLPREDALRAMTMTPAEIYGISDRVGSLEKGKIANLLVTKGEIFDNNAKVEMIFVDGKKYAPAADAAGGGRGAVTENVPGGNQ